jgi:hypothetical protein
MAVAMPARRSQDRPADDIADTSEVDAIALAVSSVGR